MSRDEIPKDKLNERIARIRALNAKNKADGNLGDHPRVIDLTAEEIKPEVKANTTESILSVLELPGSMVYNPESQNFVNKIKTAFKNAKSRIKNLSNNANNESSRKGILRDELKKINILGNLIPLENVFYLDSKLQDINGLQLIETLAVKIESGEELNIYPNHEEMSSEQKEEREKVVSILKQRQISKDKAESEERKARAAAEAEERARIIEEEQRKGNESRRKIEVDEKLRQAALIKNAIQKGEDLAKKRNTKKKNNELSEEARKSALAEHSRKEGEKLAEKRKVEESQKRIVEEEKELASLVKQIEKYKKEQEFDNQVYPETLDDLEASSRAHKIIETVVKEKSIEESFDSVAGYFEYKDGKYLELRKNVVAYLYQDTQLPEEDRKKLASVGFIEKLDAFKKEIAKLVKKFDDYDISSWEKMEIFIKREYIANLFSIDNEEVPLLNDGFSIEEFLEPYLPERILLKISLAYGAWTEEQTMGVKQIKYEKEVKKFLAEIIPKLAKKNLDNPMDEEDLDDELNVALANYPVLSELQLSSKSTFVDKVIGIEGTYKTFPVKLDKNEYWSKRQLFEYIRRKVKEGFYKVKNIDEYLNETKFFPELRNAWTARAKARFKTIFMNKLLPELKEFDFISEDDKKYNLKNKDDTEKLINSLYNYRPKKVN